MATKSELNTTSKIHLRRLGLNSVALLSGNDVYIASLGFSEKAGDPSVVFKHYKDWPGVSVGEVMDCGDLVTQLILRYFIEKSSDLDLIEPVEETDA